MAADIATVVKKLERRSKDRPAGSGAANGPAAKEMLCNGGQQGSITAVGSSPSFATSSWEEQGGHQALPLYN